MFLVRLGTCFLPDMANSAPALACDVVSDLAAASASTATYDRLLNALGGYEQDPAQPAAREEVLAAARLLARELVRLTKRDQDHPLVQTALEAVRQLAVSGVQDYAVAADDRRWMADKALSQWPNLLAAMLLGANWQWGNLPMLEAVPQWLWGDYSAWTFAAPQGFTAVGDADRYARHLLPRIEELARLVDCNLGSAAVRAAGTAYLKHSSGIPLYFAQESLRRHAEARARILKRLVGREATPFEAVPFAREGRRLRLGFLNRHFGSQTETYTTLPTFEHLDPEQFEVILFALVDADNELAGYCRSKAQDYRVLPPDIEGQLTMLRDANLDVLVFGTNITASVHELTQIALHRAAPLQVVNNSSCITSGMPEIDLYVSGDLTEAPDAPAHYSERLGLIPGPAHAFNYKADQQESTANWTRSDLGIPEDAVVFVTAANYFKIIPEMQQVWAKLLAAVPNSRLLVHPFNPNWSSTYPIKRFCAEFDRVLAENGLTADRLMVSTEKFPSRAEVGRLLSVGDVYLDTYPFGGVNSLVDPLEAGMPLVVWEGQTFRARMGAALMRSLQLPELIAHNEEEYVAKALMLATDSTTRSEWKNRIQSAMERTPVFLDTLAASDAFGALIETAFDELVSLGKRDFLRRRIPLTASTVVKGDATWDAVAVARAALRAAPADSALRRQYGKALLATGCPARASEYLLAAVENEELNSDLWLELAEAFRANGQSEQALQAVQAGLKLNPKNSTGWTMVAELARGIGAHDFAAEAEDVLQHLASHAAESAAPAVG